jgi:hypothetical protein
MRERGAFRPTDVGGFSVIQLSGGKERVEAMDRKEARRIYIDLYRSAFAACVPHYLAQDDGFTDDGPCEAWVNGPSALAGMFAEAALARLVADLNMDVVGVAVERGNREQPPE